MKRLLDILLSGLALVLSLPITLPVAAAIFLNDFHSPFYAAPRVGRNGRMFRMLKFRSMVVNADSTGVDSTGSHDARITGVGRFIRRTKLDELSQLINVLWGHMSLVGPRPNVKRETDLYTAEEQALLNVKPGITDLASIVFSDEGEILKGQSDPDVAYNQLIRPWKSRLGLFYVANRSIAMDLRIIWLTALSLVNRSEALRGVQNTLIQAQADPRLIAIAVRQMPLVPCPPPGASEIVTSRT